MELDKLLNLKQADKFRNIIFVCHGNICRSPMAEFVMKDLVHQKGLDSFFFIASAATSSEEAGNPVHPGTRDKLREYGISTAGKYAVQLTRNDYSRYDYIIGMEQRNVSGMLRILGGDPGHKVGRLLDFTGNPRDIDDPWYTGDFDSTYEGVKEGCEALLSYIAKEQGWNL